jgi:hypothetical protein
MENNIFKMYMMIIDAARNGRFMYGNGALWYIIDNGNKVLLDTVNGTTTFIPEYNGVARVDMKVANELEAFLNATDSAPEYTSYINYDDATKIVVEAATRGDFLYNNGNQCYINYAGTVSVIELGVRYQDNKAAMHTKSLHGAWKYRRFNGENIKVTMTDSIKSWLSIR